MKRTILIIFCVILCFSVCGCSLGDRKFSTEEWIQTEDSQKYHYIKDLKENYNLIGMTSQEVKELLGEPYDEIAKGEPGFGDYSTLDEKADKFFYYRIRDDILSGWNIYLIKLKDNIVFETETGVEDW
ncbi:MAG: hypothetical protein UCN61_04315 [Ruminococcus sp.]|nr:hypothetical protein [Ruminococcus sp.]